MHVYRLNNVAVEWVDTFKYLGVRILLYPLQLRPSLHRRDQTETGDEEHRDAMRDSLVSRPHFSRPLEKWVRSTAYSIFVQVRRNVGALFFSNWDSLFSFRANVAR